MRSFRFVAACAFLLAATVAGHAESIALTPYLEKEAQGIFTTVVDIDGKPATLLVDTGAGITAVTPKFAATIGCTPYGRATGFRMRGDRLDTQKCGKRRVTLGGRSITIEVSAFDLMTLLPKGAPPLDGIVGLDALGKRSFVLKLADKTLETDWVPWGKEWNEGVMRMQREVAGGAATVFVEAHAKTGTLWLLVDSGHIGGPVFLSPGAVAQLGSPAVTAPVTLSISGAGTHSLPVQVVDQLIYDGVLGETFLRQFDVAFDLGAGRIWWRKRAP